MAVLAALVRAEEHQATSSVVASRLLMPHTIASTCRHVKLARSEVAARPLDSAVLWGYLTELKFCRIVSSRNGEAVLWNPWRVRHWRCARQRRRRREKAPRGCEWWNLRLVAGRGIRSLLSQPPKARRPSAESPDRGGRLWARTPWAPNWKS